MTSAFDDHLDPAAPAPSPPPRSTRQTRATTTASSTTSPTGRRCAGSRACRPSSRTSPRSSTASCAWSGSCSSASGPRAPSQDAENSLAELAALAETAGSHVLEGLIQRRDQPDAATYIGSGKARELRDIVLATGADTVICDGELTPGQLIHLEDVVKVKVVDRTALILDIFAQHASSREGKAQVSLAQMQYMLPRLRGWGQSMSRQAGGPVARRPAASAPAAPVRPRSRPTGGGSATRWPSCAARSRDMKTARDTKRQERRRNEVPSVAIAGYTNAGQVLAAQPAHRRRRPGRERAVRDPGPDRAPGRDPGRPGVHPRRHRRLRPAPAAPAGRGVPLDAGGGRRGRPDPARRRRLARRPRGPARRRAGRAGRRRRPGRPRARRDQQGRPGRPAGARPAAPPREAQRRRLGAHRARASTSCGS